MTVEAVVVAIVVDSVVVGAVVVIIIPPIIPEVISIPIMFPKDDVNDPDKMASKKPAVNASVSIKTENTISTLLQKIYKE